MSLFPAVIILTESYGLSMLSCCLDTEDSYYLTDLQKWKRKKVKPKSIDTDSSQQMTLSVKLINNLTNSGWRQTDVQCAVLRHVVGYGKIKQFLTWVCCADHSPASFNRHPLLNLPAKAICLHKRPASKAMLVWLLNYWNWNSIIFLLVCTHTDKNTFSSTSTHTVWYPTVPVDVV